MQTGTPDHHTIFDAIARWVKDYRTALGTSRELAHCDPRDVAAIAQDLTISPAELLALADRSPSSARLLYRMLSALGVDAGALSQRDPMVMRDLERLCITCTHKRKCAHELATGGAAEHYDAFCPNAYTLDMLLEERKRTPAAAQ
jgi:hypothetical protein